MPTQTVFLNRSIILFFSFFSSVFWPHFSKPPFSKSTTHTSIAMRIIPAQSHVYIANETKTHFHISSIQTERPLNTHPLIFGTSHQLRLQNCVKHFAPLLLSPDTKYEISKRKLIHLAWTKRLTKKKLHSKQTINIFTQLTFRLLKRQRKRKERKKILYKILLWVRFPSMADNYREIINIIVLARPDH